MATRSVVPLPLWLRFRVLYRIIRNEEHGRLHAAAKVAVNMALRRRGVYFSPSHFLSPRRESADGHPSPWGDV